MKKQKMYAIYDSEKKITLYETKLEATIEMICEIFTWLKDIDCDESDEFRHAAVDFLKNPSLKSFEELRNSKEWDVFFDIFIFGIGEDYEGSVHVHEVVIKSQLNKTTKKARSMAEKFIKYEIGRWGSIENYHRIVLEQQESK